MTRGARLGMLAALGAGLVACAPAVTPKEPGPKTLAEWRGALADLRALRAIAEGGGPHTLKLSLALREPYTGRRTEARGAVALSPADRAVRMILVGPGGTTAFDLWIRADEFRVSIPAIDLLRRGDAATPKAEMRGLPVDFLRFWLLDPTRGDLLWFERSAAKTTYVLREDGAVTSLDVLAGGGFEALRETWATPRAGGSAPHDTSAAGRTAAGGARRERIDEERVTADKLGCGHARYTQASTGVEIEITCEGVEPNPPSARAFADPDAPEPEEEP